MRPGRVLGVDPGTVRIGVAVCDRDRLVATPHSTVQGGDGVAQRIVGLAREMGCADVVVGLPKSLSGRDTDSTRMARALATQISDCGLQTHLFDERLTSVQATRALRSAPKNSGRSRRSAAGSKSRSKGITDQVAASLVLQGWLDRNRPGSAPA